MAFAQTASSAPSLSLSITNPLILYRALIATRRISPDPAQHRLALELQKLYFRLKDYDPEIEYRWRLERATKLSRHLTQEKRKAVFDDAPRRSLSRFWADGPSLALTRTVPMHESAMSIDSPQGMLLYGEVGRGKSMLLDLLYSSLPTKKKRRWHFNTFILDIFRRLELARIERLGIDAETEHVILSLAKDTMDTSPILFLDEFQMPDRVSGKLVHSFFTAFFSLGGVLVASSNRMPEELAKASGVEFARMGAMRWGRGGQIWEKLSVGQKQARADFGQFVDILKKRCEVWEMEGERDWRREDGLVVDEIEEDVIMDETEANALLQTVGEGLSPAKAADTRSNSADLPAYYHISDPSESGTSGRTSSQEFKAALSQLNPSGTWEPTTLTVYARKLVLSTTSQSNGCVLLSFPQLCATNLGPADYISICSSFHTLIVTDIPILTLLQKNEARRFITFLDACYEARCRLLIEAEAPPDRLFFPETRAKRGSGNMLQEGDSIESEAFSEMYQDSTAPFRPNISSYVDHNKDERESVPSPTTSLYNKDVRSVLADEDADFGPTYGNRRSVTGLSSSAADYDSDGAALDERDNVAGSGMSELELRQGPDFTQGSGAFTGQDEQFAYKRARSRLWELCGRRWWDERSTRQPDQWWMPVHREGRFWEMSKDKLSSAQAAVQDAITPDGSHDGRSRKADAGLTDSTTTAKEDSLFRHGASPFRTSADPPPKFGWQHAWGMMTWGKKAGEWGKGVQGDRSKEQDDSNLKK